METENEQNEPVKYFCKICDYKCIKKTNFTRHLSSSKHIVKQNVYKNEKEKGKNFVCCCCGKHYKSRNGLWKHKKTCINVISTEPSDKELLLMLIKEQSELKKMVLEMCEKIKN